MSTVADPVAPATARAAIAALAAVTRQPVGQAAARLL
jgi:hypothetical protein